MELNLDLDKLTNVQTIFDDTKSYRSEIEHFSSFVDCVRVLRSPLLTILSNVDKESFYHHQHEAKHNDNLNSTNNLEFEIEDVSNRMLDESIGKTTVANRKTKRNETFSNDRRFLYLTYRSEPMSLKRLLNVDKRSFENETTKNFVIGQLCC